MKTLSAVLTAMSLLLLTSCAKPEFRERDAIVDSQLGGTWLIRKAEFAGRDLPVPPGIEMEVIGGRYRVGSTTNAALPTDRGRIVLFGDELAGQAARMDVVGEDGPNQSKRFPAIYRFNGRELEICIDFSEKDRPGEFASRKDSLLLRATFAKK